LKKAVRLAAASTQATVMLQSYFCSQAKDTCFYKTHVKSSLRKVRMLGIVCQES